MRYGYLLESEDTVGRPMNEQAFLEYCAKDALRIHRHSVARRRQFLLMFRLRQMLHRFAPGLAGLL